MFSMKCHKTQTKDEHNGQKQSNELIRTQSKCKSARFSNQSQSTTKAIGNYFRHSIENHS